MSETHEGKRHCAFCYSTKGDLRGYNDLTLHSFGGCRSGYAHPDCYREAADVWRKPESKEGRE